MTSLATPFKLSAVYSSILATLWAQAPAPKTGKNARELFYSAVDSQQSAGAPTIETHRSRAKPAKAANAHSAPGPAADSPAASNETLVSQADRPALLPSAYSPLPLGLRYSILKKVEGDLTELPPDTVFHNGDRIQLGIQVNSAGYLYIIQRGSSGGWSPLFPSAEIKDTDNQVEPDRTYVIPANGRFRFNEQPGEERLFIVLSRRPEPDMVKMIDLLRNRGGQIHGSDPHGQVPDGQIALASNVQPADDSEVDRLRTAYARDLLVEEVNEDLSSDNTDRAVYVVNPKGGEDAIVVADVPLVHR